MNLQAYIIHKEICWIAAVISAFEGNLNSLSFVIQKTVAALYPAWSCAVIQC